MLAKTKRSRKCNQTQHSGHRALEFCHSNFALPSYQAQALLLCATCCGKGFQSRVRIGADVTHMKTWQDSEPSIVAVCGSIDATATRFASCTSMQGHRMEIIQVLFHSLLQSRVRWDYSSGHCFFPYSFSPCYWPTYWPVLESWMQDYCRWKNCMQNPPLNVQLVSSHSNDSEEVVLGLVCTTFHTFFVLHSVIVASCFKHFIKLPENASLERVCRHMQDLKATVRRLLISFYRNTKGQKPRRIIFYRDGVSEGQFKAIQKEEVPQIVQACRELGENAGEKYDPPVSSNILHFQAIFCRFKAFWKPYHRYESSLPHLVNSCDKGKTLAGTQQEKASQEAIIKQT